MKIIGFIPARGGSKGIPKKNIKDLNGKPLIYYVMNAIEKSDIDEYYVSTDSNEILSTSICCFAGGKHKDDMCYLRPKELSGDNSPTEEAIEHFINSHRFDGQDIIVFVQATSPLIKPEQINDGIELVRNGNYDSVFSAINTKDISIWKKELNNFNSVNYDFKNRQMRQTRQSDYFIETGGFYIFTVDGFMQTKCRLHYRIGIIEVPFWSSLEIDEPEDFENIEAIIKLRDGDNKKENPIKENKETPRDENVSYEALRGIVK